MTKRYYKLVRDKIPEIIQADGKKLKSRVLNDAEYLEELIKKLGEEYEEFKADVNAEELADIHEVWLALLRALNITEKELHEIRLQKLAERGGFEEKRYLESIEE